jgi:glycosyltransferase involved in cell wall biosynthesis
VRDLGVVEVTVVLPTRDRWDLARAAMGSVLVQRGVELEVCVVDDGSLTPAPPGLVVDERVRLLRNDRPAGVAASRNRGVRAASAEWVAFLDDDDLWAPWHLERVLAAARAADARWAYGRYVYTDLSRESIGSGPIPSIHEDWERQFLRFNPVGTPSCAIVAAEALRQAGGFDEQLSVMADWDLWLRLAAAWRPAVSTAISVGYAQHDRNMSLDPDRLLAELTFLSHRHREMAERVGVDPGHNHHFWRWLADRFRRQDRRLPAARFYLRAAITGGGRGDLACAMAVSPVLGPSGRALRRCARAVGRRLPPRRLSRPRSLPGPSRPASGHPWPQLPGDRLPAVAAEMTLSDSGSSH